MMTLFKAALVSAVVLILSACGATTQTATPPHKNKPVAATSPEEEKVAALPEAPEPEEAVSISLPKAGVLMGKTTQEIREVFGSPVLLRKDKPAEVWQYLTKDCALHLIFYPTTKENSSSLIVQHVSMNDRNKVIVVESQACFDSQLRRVGEDRAQSLG